MVKKVFRVLDKHQKSRVIILLVMIFIGAILETVGVSAILPFVSVVTNPEIIETNKYLRLISDVMNIHDPKLFVLVTAIAMIVIYILKNIYLILLNMAQNNFSTNNLRRMSVRLMRCYMDQNYLYHAEHNVAELDRNVKRDVSGYLYVLTNMLMMVTEILVCIMLSIFLMINDFFTTLLMIVMLVAFLLFFTLVLRRKLKYYGNLARSLEEDKNRYFLEAFGGIKEVKAASSEDYFVNKYDEAFKGNAFTEQKRLILTYIPRPLMESLCICGLLLFMSIKIVMGADSSTFIPFMAVFGVAAIRMLPSFNRISGHLGSIMFFKASVDGVYEDLEEAKRLEQHEKAVDQGIEITLDDVCVQNVTFAYPSRPEKRILDNVSISIPLNKAVAFVGPSGAGKTTLADIILGVIDPQEGHILVGGVDVIKNKKNWHKNIGYIPQSTFLIDDTIRANVAFGIEEEEIDDNKVWEALKAAQLYDFVKEQPDGIYSNIGDRGVKISGGQRQRVGIARALYNNPGIIVLDEATSALDNETEKAVMDAIYQLSGKKTMIIIAHRLTTVEHCDIIYEIKDGKANKVSYEDISGNS